MYEQGTRTWILVMLCLPVYTILWVEATRGWIGDMNIPMEKLISLDAAFLLNSLTCSCPQLWSAPSRFLAT